VYTSLTHRAKALCDPESLAPELILLTNVFEQNGYSQQQIQQAMKPGTRTKKTEEKEENPYPLLTYHIPKPPMENLAGC